MELNKIKIHEVLKCNSEDTISSIAKKLKDNNERRIFVVDSEDKLLGIITTTDLVYKVLSEEKENLKAEDIMTKDVKSIDTSEDFNKALEIMNDIKSFSCPITENNKIIGLISYHDLIGHVFSTLSDDNEDSNNGTN